MALVVPELNHTPMSPQRYILHRDRFLAEMSLEARQRVHFPLPDLSHKKILIYFSFKSYVSGNVTSFGFQLNRDQGATSRRLTGGNC